MAVDAVVTGASRTCVQLRGGAKFVAAIVLLNRPQQLTTGDVMDMSATCVELATDRTKQRRYALASAHSISSSCVEPSENTRSANQIARSRGSQLRLQCLLAASTAPKHVCNKRSRSEGEQQQWWWCHASTAIATAATRCHCDCEVVILDLDTNCARRQRVE